MKKFIALALALVMMLSMAAFASAEDKPVITIAVSAATNVEDFNTNNQTLLIEEAVGVDMQFEVYPNVDYNTKINMMIMTGGAELPDVIFVTPSDAELLNWTGSGLLIPLTEYYADKELSKNIWDTVERTGSDWTKMMTLADGNIYAIPTLNQSYTNEYGGKAFYNTKWLEALNTTAPTTPEELYELLKLVKATDLNGNGKNDEIGMVGNMKGHSGWFNYIMNAYIYAGHGDKFVVTEDDKVIVAYNTEEWKEGLKFIRKLFAEELLPIEILTQDDNQFLAMLNSEDCTAMSFFYTSPSRINAAKAYRSDFEAYAPLINKDTGKPLASYNPSVPNNGSFFITANCKNPELAFRIGDEMVSQYHSISTRWGQEGIDWDYCENVKDADKYVAWVDGFEKLILAYDDAKFWSSGEIQNRSYIQKGPYIREYGIANGRMKDPSTATEYDAHVNAADNLYQVESYGPEKVVTKLIYTAEEMEILADLKVTINEYRNEMTANFLAGQIDIDAGWDAYVAELEAMGLAQYLEIINDVYTRMYVTAE